MLIIVKVESYERFDWLMGLWGKFAMSTEMFSGLILITGSNYKYEITEMKNKTN